MATEERKQIESVNEDLYSDLNLEQLEERLEMTKLAGLYACNCDNKDCIYKAS